MYWIMLKWLGAWTISLIVFYAWSAALNVCVPNRPLDDLPTRSTACRVDGYSRQESSGPDKSPSAQQTSGVWACKSKYACYFRELSNPTPFFPLPLGSQTGDTIPIYWTPGYLKMEFFLWDQALSKILYNNELSSEWVGPHNRRMSHPLHSLWACSVHSTRCLMRTNVRNVVPLLCCINLGSNIRVAAANETRWKTFSRDVTAVRPPDVGTGVMDVHMRYEWII